MVSESVRYQDPSVPLDATAAERADNYSAQTALYATHKRILAMQDELASLVPAVEGRSGNTIFITKTSGGEYESLQDAVDAASDGDVVVVGAGSWGEVSLKPGVSLMGLQPPQGADVVLSKLTFQPTSGVAATNTVYVSNLRISVGANASGLVLGSASAPVRVHLDGVRLYRNKADATVPLVLLAGTDASTSIYMRDCLVGHEGGQNASTITLVSSSARYVDLNNCTFHEGGRQLDITAGQVAASLCRFETESSMSAIRIGTNSALAIGNSLVRNLATNATGIEMLNAGTSVCAASDTVFDVGTGTGKCIGGVGILAKNNLTVQPVALGARNTSIAGPTALSFQVL